MVAAHLQTLPPRAKVPLRPAVDFRPPAKRVARFRLGAESLQVTI